MKYFLYYSITVMLLTACDEEKQTGPLPSASGQTAQYAELQQYLQQIEKKHQGTPSSLTGSELQTGPNPHNQLSPEQHIAVAMQHAEHGRLGEALDILARAIIANPNDASLLGALGGVLLSRNRAAEALEYLEEAVALAPYSAELLVNRSQAYRKVKRSEEAMTDLDKAISLSPGLVPAHFNRGVMLYDEAKYQEALADFDICIRVAPETAGPYFNRAVTRDAMGDQAGAMSDMKKFIELSDNPEWNKVAQDTMAGWGEKSD